MLTALPAPTAPAPNDPAVAKLERLGDSLDVLYSFEMPYERITLGPRYALRLGDLQATDAIEIDCPECRRRALEAQHRLHDRFAAFERLTQLCRRMRLPTVWQRRRNGVAGRAGQAS